MVYKEQITICVSSFTVALVASQSVSSCQEKSTKPKAKASLSKAFKKPLSNGPSNVASKPGNNSRTKTSTEKKKPAQSPKLNRRPVQKPEVLENTNILFNHSTPHSVLIRVSFLNIAILPIYYSPGWQIF